MKNFMSKENAAALALLAGVMRKEDAVERLKFEKINDQMCFNTEKALQTLRFVKSYTL